MRQVYYSSHKKLFKLFLCRDLDMTENHEIEVGNYVLVHEGE